MQPLPRLNEATILQRLPKILRQNVIHHGNQETLMLAKAVFIQTMAHSPPHKLLDLEKLEDIMANRLPCSLHFM